jgi:diguanylate cyclase (GGDEF)-like protein/PAS domain S-box-containing protein
VSVSHLPGAQSARAGTVVIARDIHERKRAEESIRQSEARFRALAETGAAAVFIFEGDRLRYVNPALESITGCAAEDLLARPLSTLAAPEHREMLGQRAASLGPGSNASRFELKLATRHGPHRWVDVTLAPVEIEGRTWTMATAFDVTDHKVAEEAARESERRLRDMLETVRLASLLLDAEGNVTFCNDYLLELLGLEEEQILGRNWFEQCLPPEQRESALARFREEMAAGVLSPHQEGSVLTSYGETRALAWSSTLLRDLEGRAVGTASLGVDMTEQKRAESKLLHDAMHDALTGLPNRALFMDRLGGAMARAKRRQSYQFAVLFLDVDRFKVVNDSLGHLMGDQLLLEIGRRLEASLRPGDTVARLGGDEFTVLLDDMADTDVPARVAERVQSALNAPFQVAGREVFVTVSIGIAQNKARYLQPEDFLRDADTAMYHAKALGKARYEEFDTAMHAQAMGLLQIENDLRKAVERGELRLYYQPFLSLRTGAIAGFEALVRWQHPQRGLVSPADFIRVAEETGLILPLGAWVLSEACRQLRAWDSRLPDEKLVMSVNLSGKQFSQPDLGHEVGRVLQDTGVAPRRLKLEITESVLMEDPDAAAATLAALRAQGTQVCIDDFGTGYSSLSYLLRFPADTLKIDRSFVSHLSAGTQQWELVRTILTLARNLGMDVIAEGVENDDQLARLDALECDYVQGYHLSRPVDADTAMRLLTTEPLRLPSRLGAS